MNNLVKDELESHINEFNNLTSDSLSGIEPTTELLGNAKKPPNDEQVKDLIMRIDECVFFLYHE